MGDISQVMPTLHPYMGGASGSGHGADYEIADPKLAYVEPAKQLALMAVDMLWDDAAAPRGIIAEGRKPPHDQGGSTSPSSAASPRPSSTTARRSV